MFPFLKAKITTFFMVYLETDIFLLISTQVYL